MKKIPPMRIDIRSERAERIIAEHYAGNSNPLTITTCVRSPHDIQSWQSSPQSKRRSGMTLEYATIRYHQELMSISLEVLAPHSLPVVFDRADGQRSRPDKGRIKSLSDSGLISGRTFNDELVFAAPESGRPAHERH